MAEVFQAIPEDDDNAEVLVEPPEDSLSLEEAFFAKHTLNNSTIRSRLSRLVENFRTLQKSRDEPNPVFRPFRNSSRITREPKPVPPLPVEPSCEVSRSCKPADPEPTHHVPALVATTGGSERVLAILDTGASRCVMGSTLLPRFLRQVPARVQKLIRVTSSQVKFRFGNNQTLTSQKRVMIPLHTTRGFLWLGIEIVPGATPLLFSKRAIKQLGGVIDTNQDVLRLERVKSVLRLELGPTGLYLLDLARLCEESRDVPREDLVLPSSGSADAHAVTPLHVVGSSGFQRPRAFRLGSSFMGPCPPVVIQSSDVVKNSTLVNDEALQSYDTSQGPTVQELVPDMDLPVVPHPITQVLHESPAQGSPSKPSDMPIPKFQALRCFAKSARASATLPASDTVPSSAVDHVGLSK